MSSSKTNNRNEASSSSSSTCPYLPAGSLFTSDRLKQLKEHRQTHSYKQQLTKIYTLRITIDHINPQIFRVVNVPAKLTLDQVHHVIMYSLGWADYHCAHFPDPFSPDLYWDVLDEYPYQHPVVLHAEKATLADVFCNCNRMLKYEYDFGDSWWHTLELTEVRQKLYFRGGTLTTNRPLLAVSVVYPLGLLINNFMLDRTASSSAMYFPVFLVDLLLKLRWAWSTRSRLDVSTSLSLLQ